MVLLGGQLHVTTYLTDILVVNAWQHVNVRKWGKLQEAARPTNLNRQEHLFCFHIAHSLQMDLTYITLIKRSVSCLHNFFLEAQLLFFKANNHPQSSI